MIQINDNDLPIMVAEKIINGTKPYNPTDLMKAFAKAITGNEHSSDTQDMFDIEEIKEIADYLMVYYQAHQNGEDVKVLAMQKCLQLGFTPLIKPYEERSDKE